MRRREWWLFRWCRIPLGFLGWKMGKRGQWGLDRWKGPGRRLLRRSGLGAWLLPCPSICQLSHVPLSFLVFRNLCHSSAWMEERKRGSGSV